MLSLDDVEQPVTSLPVCPQVIHRITAESPLWTVTAESLLLQEMEIVVVLEGVVEGTGMSTQVRPPRHLAACQHRYVRRDT